MIYKNILVVNKKIFITLFFILFFIKTYSYNNFIIPDKPNIIYPINDFVGILNDSEKRYLNNKIINYNKISSIEIVVIIIKNLNGNDPSLLASNWGQKWKIGKKKYSNGLVILLSINDRKISIQTGYGVEEYITDILSKQIIENKIKKYLSDGKYFLAIKNGTSYINKILNNKYKKENNSKNKLDNKYYSIILIASICIMYIIKKINNNKKEIISHTPPTPTYEVYEDFINNYPKKNIEDFEGFGGGGTFGGGGSSDNW